MSQIRNFFYLSRIDKPVGTFLIMLPCWWGLAVAQADIFLYLLFALGSFIMRSFGCILNDWIDCDFDKKVKRTVNRPFASGSVSVGFVKISLVLYLCLGFLIWLHLNNLAKIISLIGLVLCLIYPWMKRITNWPQLVLGLAFNIGVLVGYAASCGILVWNISLLYISGICWTLSYDTVYAFQDYEDDVLLNIGSTARVAAHNPKFFIGIWSVLWLLSLGSWFYFSTSISLLASVIYVVLWGTTFHHIWKWNPNETTSCARFFKRHTWYGWAILAIILLSNR